MWFAILSTDKDMEVDLAFLWNNRTEVAYDIIENASTGDPTGNGTLSTAPEFVDQDEGGKSLAQILWIYAGPVIFVTGIVGNILVLVVMGTRRMQGTTTCVYLRLMAIADICVLITGMIPEWLEHADITVFKYIHPATCKLEKFSFYTCADTAIWILVIFTVDRFIAVCFPLSKKAYCLPSKAKFYALGAVLLAITKNFHVFWTRGAEYIVVGNDTVLKSNCGRPTPEIKYFEFYVRPWIAFSLVSLVPFLVILVCNVFIIRALLEVKRLRHEQAIMSQNDKTLVQMTTMCLSASFCFLICVAPSIIILIGKPYWKDKYWYDIAKAINNQLVYVNHSINFFLYCMTGRRFRHQLVRVCRCCCRGRGALLDSYDTRTTVYKVSNSRMASPGAHGCRNVSSGRSPFKVQSETKNGGVQPTYTKMEPIPTGKRDSHGYIAQALREELESSM